MIKPKTINSTTLKKDNEFLQWFVGFSDAESAFMINIKNNKLYIFNNFIYLFNKHL